MKRLVVGAKRVSPQLLTMRAKYISPVQLTAVLCLLLMFWIAVHSMEMKSPTMDEQGFLVRGLGLARGENDWMRVGHPAGLNLLNASLLWRDERVQLPTEHPSWQETSFHRPAELFLWEIGNDVEYTMFLARLPSVWIGMVLACVCGRFAFDVTRKRAAGLFALAIVAFDPNILAHTRLTTTDLGFTAGVVIGVYTLWLFLRGEEVLPSRQRLHLAVVAGIGFAIMQNTKFTAGLFLPIFALIILIALIEQWGKARRFPAKKMVMLVTIYPLSAFIALWAMYGFDVGTLPESLPTFGGMLSGRTLPLAHHIEQLSDLGGRMAKGTPAFLRGDYSETGWWTYFPIAFALKTPLVTLLITILGFWGVLAKPCEGFGTFARLGKAALIIPPIAFFAFGMTNSINIGYRHILLVVPFIAIWGGVWIARLQEKGQWYTGIGTILGVLLLLETVLIAPDFLAYFNPIAGGAENGWRSLVDSNIDWGQDLARLDDWMMENDVEEVRLSYFGEARPEYYGINYVGLPSSPPRLMRPNAITHYPPNPAPGIYAISATNLQGVLFDDRDEFAFFRDKEPIDHVGHSILLYEVEATGEPIVIALGNLQFGDNLSGFDLSSSLSSRASPRSDHFLLGWSLRTNNRRLTWFDSTSSIVFPSASKNLTYMVIDEENRHPWIQAVLDDDFYAVGTFPDRMLVNINSAIIESYFDNPIATFVHGDQKVIFEHTRYLDDTEQNKFQQIESNDIEWATIWRQNGTSANIKLFMHIEDESGKIVGQWDGLGVVWDSWHEGDWLVQVMQARVPDDVVEAGGTFDVWFGVYDAVTGARWAVEDGSDRHYGGEIVLE